jgi:hypothetical protein
MKKLLENMTDLEVLILRATVLVLLLAACVYVVWTHIKPIFEMLK